MKKHTLKIFGLAALIVIAPSFTHPIDVTRDGVTVRVIQDRGRSNMLQDYNINLACLHVRIKNDTNNPLEMPRHGFSTSFTADEKMLTEVMNSMKKYIGSYIAAFLLNTMKGVILTSTTLFSFDKINNLSTPHNALGFMTILKTSIIGSLIVTTGIEALCAAPAKMIYNYHKQAKINSALQEYLNRKAITIPPYGEIGFYTYINLDQYEQSISKNIIARINKKDSDQSLIYEINTTGMLREIAA